jgi:uncharacterized membrane protein
MHIVSLYAIAVVFVGAGVAHFVWPDVFVRIVPPYLPAPRVLVLVSGAAEILGGVGVLVPAMRLYAGWGLILLLVAVVPANVHMALHPDDFARIPRWALYVRLPLQLVLILWVYATVCR